MSIEEIAKEKYPFNSGYHIADGIENNNQKIRRAAFIAGAKYGKEWISVEEGPLATFDEKGWWICTENGYKEFIAAVPYNDKNKPNQQLWWIRHCVIEDKIGLCVVTDDDHEVAGWDLKDVTHYQFLPEPPIK